MPPLSYEYTFHENNQTEEGFELMQNCFTSNSVVHSATYALNFQIVFLQKQGFKVF